MIARAIFNQTPLPPNRLSQLPLGAVQPQGWLGDHMKKLVSCLEEDLPAYFPGVQGESSWLGGKMDDGESAPEALNSLTYIAYVTGSAALKKAVETFADWAIASQKDNGDFGPEGLTDWWPKMLMLRVMRQYFLATGNRDALKLMDRFFLFQLESIHDLPLTGKACARAAENMQAALWLYNLTGQKHLLTLCRELSLQSLDWTNEMHIFPHIRDTAKQRPWSQMMEGMAREGELIGNDQKVNGREYHLTNAVNAAFGLKTPGIINLFKSGFKEVSAFRVGWAKYMKQHGVALSMFTGDDHLAGTDPARGVSLCAVAETIQSIAALLGTGDEFSPELADLMEKLALNAPIAARNADCDQRAALIQANQLSLSEGAHGFYSAAEDALCIKKRPLDLSDQAEAAYIASMWYATSDHGLAVMGYAPATVNFVAGGQRVRVHVEGNYPFSGAIKIRVETHTPAEFPIYLHIPGWVDQVMITLPDGELMQMQGGETACVRRKWLNEGVISMELAMQPRISRWFHQSAAVEMGPMLMALDIDENPEWNWAIDAGQPMKGVMDGHDALFPKTEKPGSQVLVKALAVPKWTRRGGDCDQPVINPEVQGEAQVVKLVPFASTTRRVSQFPVVRRD